MREAVGLFSNMKDLQEAVKELERTDFSRDSLSVIGTKEEIERRFGTSNLNPEFAADNENVPRNPLVRDEEKTLGKGVLISASGYIGAVGLALISGAVSVPAIITAAAVGGASGAAIGAVLVKILGDHFNHEVENQIKRGGLLLWVRTPTENREMEACSILKRYGAGNVHVHDIDISNKD